MKLVILESPFSGDIDLNIKYARMCVKDCLMRGEAPIASHLLFTQEGILDDYIPEERKLGMEAGFAWYSVAETAVVYTDRGISNGMSLGIKEAIKNNVKIEYRKLFED